MRSAGDLGTPLPPFPKGESEARGQWHATRSLGFGIANFNKLLGLAPDVVMVHALQALANVTVTAYNHRSHFQRYGYGRPPIRI